MGEKGLFHYNDSGYKVDLSKQQEQLAEKAYIDGFDPENHDEYLVNGAILTCSKAVTDVKVLHGRVYNVKKPSKETVLTVTENPQAKCCGYLYHATVEDRKVEINIPPFRCNCSREPHNDKEWDKLEADESCMEEGTCKALINLHDQWDNLPAENPYLLFWNEDRRGMVQGITMSSMLFCRHGGIITPVESGQLLWLLGVYAIACATRGGPTGALTDEQKVANARYIYNFFIKQGWSTEAICGMLGNMEKECGMNPGIWQDWGNDKLGYGLVQWSGAIDYLNFAHISVDEVNRMAQNNPQGLMDKQLEFLVKSFVSQDGVDCRWLPKSAEPYYNKLPLSDNVPHQMSIEEYSHSTYDSKDLALVFHATYERSGDNADQLQERVDNAEAWYLYFTTNRRE